MRQHFSRLEPYLTPLLGFSGLYLASLIVLTLLFRWVGVERPNLALSHVASLGSAIIATAICVIVFERGSWSIGIFVPWRTAVRGLIRGLLAGVLIVGVTDAVLVSLSGYGHTPGGGMDWRLVFVLLVPAAIGEELVFRGYVLQRLYGRNRGWAVCVTSVLFAFAHGGNPAMSPIAFVNIILAGVLLAFMWAWDESLWMPTWGHIAWNVMAGPVLGHELSGLDLAPTMLMEVDPGPAWLTGGDFGIEGSIVLTIVEIVSIVVLAWRITSRERALRRDARGDGGTSSVLPDALSGLRANQNE